ncbi:hypothetical protein [Arthrobacter sp. YC-RL1]|uniref:hypothetical protein n=1 Tax=Arthrobacter sp. YC-RL1 TaxID=1652545 RepID=UPI000A4B36F2|nr:hypothetical protein [Arthrobacter sp. YC-RL1]
MSRLRKILAGIASSAIALALVAGGSAPTFAVEQSLTKEKSVAEDLEMDLQEYQQIKELAENDELEIWAGGKRFYSPDGSTLSKNSLAAAAYKPQTWGACGSGSASSKHVRTWQVATTPYASKAAVLKCGTWTAKKPDGGWGYRHIQGKHGNEWKQLGALVGANWRDIADFAISDSMKNIYSGSAQVSNNTYKYKGIVQLKKYNGSVVKTYYTTIAVDQTDRRIITAYYRSKK